MHVLLVRVVRHPQVRVTQVRVTQIRVTHVRNPLIGQPQVRDPLAGHSQASHPLRLAYQTMLLRRQLGRYLAESTIVEVIVRLACCFKSR
jgi:hypothetical protein